MQLTKTSIVISALALLMLGCAPGHMHHHGPGMEDHHLMGCGPNTCLYGSRCYSNGAVRSNNGVCQGCNGGQWIAANGCTGDGGCHMCGGDGKGGCCGGKMGDKSTPCGGDHKGGGKGPHGSHK